MFFYIALFAWAVTMVAAYFNGTVKLAGFSLIAGLIIIYLVYFQSLGVIGQTLLCALALATFFGEKLLTINSK